MKEQILKLRAEGKTYNEIKAIVGCSKGTISYHCGDGQKEKNNKRVNIHKNKKNGLNRKVDTFLNRKLRHRVNHFQDRKTASFNAQSIIDKFGQTVKCYLSGINIDLLKDNNYQFDHILPITRGGDNSIENLGILHKTVNQMKHNLLNEELIDWCKKILEHQGYDVKKCP